jgi:hypothetical protein
MPIEISGRLIAIARQRRKIKKPRRRNGDSKRAAWQA